MDTKGLQKEFINWCKANKKSPKSEQETKLLFVSFMKEKHPEEYKAAIENLKKQQQAQAQKAAHGAKLNYFKSLKNQCAEDEEVVYYKKGGSVICGCKKKEDGGQINKASIGGVVERFKNRAKQKIEEAKAKVNAKKFKNDYSSKKVKQSQEDYEKGISDHEVNKCGGKMKKASRGAIAEFKKARCGSKLKKHLLGGSLNRIPFYLLGNTITVYDPYKEALLINNREKEIARQYFNSTPNISNIWNGLKHAYNGWINPSTGYLTGTAPLPGFSRNLIGLGKVVKTINGVNYYKNAAGELKTAQEMAKEIKAAKDALRLTTKTTSPNVQTVSSTLKVPTRTPEKYTQSIRDNISFIEDGFKKGTLKWEDLTWKDLGLWNKFGDPNLRIPRYSSEELKGLIE